ncbi:VOC family protein [Nocardioides ochotonae]|uniref:VOC family protein n=1 Tax=Nocardioides ochotonae TaxID=2685869 RepID=UPI00140A6331|nr:VOC family protein [Nocardioides ochotonae]
MNSMTPYLCVRDARAAMDWYAGVLGAHVADGPILMDDGRVGHVELDADGARWMMADPFPDLGVEAPDPAGATPVTLHLGVPDVDALVARALDAGARLDRSPEDGPGGRVAVLRDPFDHRWMLNGPSRT